MASQGTGGGSKDPGEPLGLPSKLRATTAAFSGRFPVIARHHALSIPVRILSGPPQSRQKRLSFCPFAAINSSVRATHVY